MTAHSWLAYVLTAAGLIGALAVIWTKAVRPIAKSVARFLSLLDQLLEVLKEWPTIQLAVFNQASEFTALSIKVGEVDARVVKLEKRRPPHPRRVTIP